jgi:integrase
MRRLTALDLSRPMPSGMHHDAASPGLYLQIRGASRVWIYRYSRNGKPHWFGIGSARAIPLKRARQLATEARQCVAEGGDPIKRRRAQRNAERVEQAKAMSFKECAASYVASHESAWRSSKHHQQWAATLAYLNPMIGALPVRDIDVSLVLKCVSPIWTEKPVTAGRVRSRLESILDFAKARGDRDGENPARWRGHLDNLLPKVTRLAKVEHFAALPYDQIGGLMAGLRAQTNTAARCLEFTILTAARSGEALGARWDEIDLQAKLWTVPASRMKGSRLHRVPLSARAAAIVCEQQSRREQGGYVFPGTRDGAPLGNMTLLAVLRKVTSSADVTVHGTARASFKTWAAERTAFPRELIEAALAHITGDATEQAYARGDMLAKRRQLMTAWSEYCARPAQAAATSKVISMRVPA